jgi:protein O-mannosyl-transferase
MPRIKFFLPYLGLTLLVLAVYANHFQNTFHYDDFHSITGNVFLQDLRNVPRFFVDAKLFSTMPDHAMYRPVVSASLALDYRLGHDYKPFYFHLSTFLWFTLQLVLMVGLFRRIMDLADPHPSNQGANQWTALAATACYGLHPANAESVNYIIQRADEHRRNQIPSPFPLVGPSHEPQEAGHRPQGAVHIATSSAITPERRRL